MPEPYCLAMVLCDAVHVDRSTGKWTILGTFSTVSAQSFPTKTQFTVYYALTDVADGSIVTFRMVDSKHGFDEDSKAIIEQPITIRSPSPLAVCEGILVVDNAELQSPGVYHCELLHENEVLMSRRLVAIDASSFQKGES